MLKGKEWMGRPLTLGNGVSVGMVGGSITTLPDPDPLISCCSRTEQKTSEFQSLTLLINNNCNSSLKTNVTTTTTTNLKRKKSSFYTVFKTNKQTEDHPTPQPRKEIKEQVPP